MAANPPQVVKARLYSVQDDSAFIVVHFNPASLVYSVESSTPQQSGDPRRRQFAAQFTGKLTMDLIFDTTHNGDDVRNYTNTVAAFMQPPGSSTQGADGPAPATNASSPPRAQPVVAFEWGVYTFKGVMESFRETIDFFSAEGVPLRAVVSIGMARQDQVFDEDAPAQSSHVQGSLVPTGSDGSPQQMADLGGDSGAARQLASDNGLDSLRFSAGASLQVNASVQLNAAAGFSVGASAGGGLGLSLGGGAGVSGGAGIGISGGAGFSAGGSAGFSGGASAGFSAGASAGFSASVGGSASGSSSFGAGFSAGAGVSAGAASGAIFGSSASMGVPATMGAFAGLETGRAKVSTTAQLDPTRMLRATSGADVSTYSGASFSLGGSANNNSGAGLSASVGSSFSFRDRLTFDNDD